MLLKGSFDLQKKVTFGLKRNYVIAGKREILVPQLNLALFYQSVNGYFRRQSFLGTWTEKDQFMIASDNGIQGND